MFVQKIKDLEKKLETPKPPQPDIAQEKLIAELKLKIKGYESSALALYGSKDVPKKHDKICLSKNHDFSKMPKPTLDKESYIKALKELDEQFKDYKDDLEKLMDLNEFDIRKNLAYYLTFFGEMPIVETKLKGEKVTPKNAGSDTPKN